MPKRRATKKQLRNLAKGRAIRKRNLLKKRRQTRRQKPKRKMAKRRRTNGSLTGGTHDINPQILTITWEQVAADSTQNTTVNNPVAKGLFAQRNNATLMEILKVTIYAPNYPSPFTVGYGPQFRRCLLSVSPLTTAVYDASHQHVLVLFEDTIAGAFTAGGSYGFGPVCNVYTQDLTDGVGHGILVGADQLHFQSRLYPVWEADARWTVKILYRFKNVGLPEYIGIVQSQQG